MLFGVLLKFAELNLEANLLKSIESHGYSEPTPIQIQAIPPILEGKDVAGLAQTGTGKTAAFVIPLIERILMGQKNPAELQENEKEKYNQRAIKDWKNNHFVMILVPTRELAEQVQENIQKFGKDCGLRSFAIYGGTGYEKQKEALRNGVEFIVATPGRLIDLYKENLLDLKQVRAVVFDEADRMFDMGFKDDMCFLLQRIPRNRQFLVFSATLNFDVLNTAYQFGAEPIELNISRDQTKAENVRDEIFHVGNDEKPMHLLSTLNKYKPQQAIIFTNYKTNVEKIAKFLSDNGFPAMAISSLITQAQRTKVMQQFKAENHLNILVATDVAARGLDIKGVDLVINFELPSDSESYVHRIGRTGRAGSEGRAFSLVSDRDIDSLYRIEDYLKHKLNIGFLEDQDLLKEFKPYPKEDFFIRRPQNHENGNGQYRQGGGRPYQGRRHPRRGEGRGEGRGDSRDNRNESRDNRDRDSRDSRDNRDENRRYGKPSQRSDENNKSKSPYKKPYPAKKHSHGPKDHDRAKSHQPYKKNFKRTETAPAKKATSIKQKVVGFFKGLIGQK